MILEANKSRIDELTILGLLLWPDNDFEDLKDDFSQLMESEYNKVYLYFHENSCVAFIHLSVRRDYVEGSNSSPVAYVEGIYVKPEYRRQGISKQLITAGEQWGRALGCTQIASDIEQSNTESFDFHLGVGFKETNRLITFIKDIRAE